MLARLIRLVLLFEVFGYFLAGVALMRLAGWGAWAVFLAMLFCAVALRGLPVLATYLHAWVHSATHHGGFHGDIIQRVREGLREWWAFLLLSFVAPFDRLFMGADRSQVSAEGQAPLLLIHGYCCNRGLWWWLRRRLEAAGRSVGTMTLEPLFVGIDSYTEQIARRIDALCRETGAERVTLVGYGMGGLACLAYLRFYGEDRVARLVTIATPHRGNSLASLFPGRNAEAMAPGNVWLRELAGYLTEIPCFAFRAAHDNLVMPSDAAIFPGAENRALAGVGHLSLTISPVLLKELLAVTAVAAAPKAS